MNKITTYIAFNNILGQYRLISLLTILLSVDVLLRIVSSSAVSVAEFILTVFILLSILLHRVSLFNQYLSARIVPLYLFLAYFIAHILYSTIYHAIANVHVNITESLLSNIFEFRVSLLGYFMIILFMGISQSTELKLDQLFLTLLKLIAVYTIIEQLLSLVGLRTFFEILYKNSGIVSDNLIGLKSLGLYRVWGLVGSTQLLGLVHLFLFVRLFCTKSSKFWQFIAFLSIMLSTSKTAYFIFIALVLLYYYKRNKKIFIAITTTISTIVTYAILYINDISNINISNFFESIGGFFLIATSTFNPETNTFEQGGAVNKMLDDLSTHSYLLGKGITYSYDTVDNIPSFLTNYYYITSDYYIVSFTQQFGIIGLLLFTTVFCFVPIKNFFQDKDPVSCLTLFIFFLAAFHYPPQISKLVMVFVCYALWKVYAAKPLAVE